MTSDTADSSSIEANAAAEARGKRPVWNVPSNGANEVGPVMGAVSWPALSEAATTAKASPKSLSSDSLKSLSDGSTSAAASVVRSHHKSFDLFAFVYFEVLGCFLYFEVLGLMG